MVRLRHNLAGNCAAWVAIIAMALNALWPLIAQAKPGEAAPLFESRGESGVYHGTESAIHHGTESAIHHGEHANHGDSAPAEPSPLMPHCGFCSLTGSGFAVLVSDFVAAVVLLIDTEEFRLASPEVRPIAVFSCSIAHPRAPPVLS